ncbi:hypothetical protein GGX14DRAFT_702035 [Mycena pura]|uniref:Uncharacterized protein n=1 Tax=Mycena pura TaxID=153505 RepID=A0AAD6UKB9_9AGAR|nr:hypothetical protein GGX14DRAFT_702035 [Mycena pura]
MAISLVALNMASVVLESLLYGAFLILFSAGLYLRISRHLSQSSRNGLCWNPVVISTVAIFLTCTGHWILTLVRFFRAFLESEAPGAALAYYSCSSDLLVRVGGILTIIALWIGDAVIIHRLWVIWNRNPRVVILPVLSWCGLIIVSLVGLIMAFKHAQYNKGAMIVSWIFEALTNVYCTAFIAGRLWSARQAPQKSQAKLLTSVLAVTVESAAILATWTIFFAVTSETQSPLLLIVMNLTAQIIGLTNMLIHIRIGLGWSTHGDNSTGVVMTSDASIFAVKTESSELRIPHLRRSQAHPDNELQSRV